MESVICRCTCHIIVVDFVIWEQSWSQPLNKLGWLLTALRKLMRSIRCPTTQLQFICSWLYVLRHVHSGKHLLRGTVVVNVAAAGSCVMVAAGLGGHATKVVGSGVDIAGLHL